MKGHVEEPAFQGLVGVGRRDVTPRVGIYSRNWGAATHDTAEGVHRPFFATALAIGADDGDPALVLLGLDQCTAGPAADEDDFVRTVTDAVGLLPEQLIVAQAHTHSSASIVQEQVSKPGGHLIAEYRTRLAKGAASACREAIESRRPAVITWATGHCDLARNRDYFDRTRYVCGFNPDGPSDGTLLVGRVTDAAGVSIATIVNYACHPTTLGPLNRQLSPDFVGAAREVVEGETGGAPCLFLQGASGDLGPREGFTDDVAVADKNGRTLGWSTLATLSNLLPPATGLRYQGPLESGATLAIWQREAAEPSPVLHSSSLAVELPLKDRATIHRITDSWKTLDDRVRVEREERRRRALASLPGQSVTVPVRIWRIGDGLLVAQPNEAYSVFQRELRARAKARPVMVLSLAGGPSRGYLPPDATYDHEADLYQVWQTPFRRGALETFIDVVGQAVAAAA